MTLTTVTVVDGKYKLGRCIGRGGEGEVYEAVDVHLHRRVALKMLKAGSDARAAERFDHGARAASMVEHPNVLEIYDRGWHERDGSKVPYFVMPLLEGWTLDIVAALEFAQFSIDHRLELVRQIGSGMIAAHAKGVLHRDLKPGNIFYTSGRRIKILDFGIALVAGIEGSGSIRGTPGYIAPEVLQGAEFSRRSDIYSLGVCTYELLARRRAFKHGKPQPLCHSNPDVTPAVSRMIEAAMEEDPEKRPESVEEFLSCLEQPQKPPVEALPWIVELLTMLATAARTVWRRKVQVAYAAGSMVVVAFALVYWRSSTAIKPSQTVDVPQTPARITGELNPVERAQTQLEITVEQGLGLLLDGKVVKIDAGRGVLNLGTGLHDVQVLQGQTPIGHIAFDAEAKHKFRNSSGVPFVLAITWDQSLHLFGPRRAFLSGVPIDVPAEGYIADKLAEGDRRVVGVDHEGTRFTLPVTGSMGVVCRLMVFARTQAPIQIHTEDEATVEIDGRDTGRSRNGLLTAMVTPGEHTIGVSKSGYKAATKSVTIRRGEAKNEVTIELLPLPVSLRIHDTAGRAEVLVDGKVLGTSEPGLPFVGEVMPGIRSVELRAQHHDSIKKQIEVQPGVAASLNWADLLIPMGYLRVIGAPAGVTFQCKRDGGASHEMSAGIHKLPVGRYNCNWSPSSDRFVEMHVRLGIESEAKFQLPAVHVADSTSSPAPSTQSVQNDTSGFENQFTGREGEWRRLHDDRKATYPYPLGLRPAQFEVRARGGPLPFFASKKVAWVLRFPNGQARFVLDRNNLICFVNDQKVDSVPVKSAFTRIEIKVDGDSIVHVISDPNDSSKYATMALHCSRLNVTAPADARLVFTGPIEVRLNH